MLPGFAMKMKRALVPSWALARPKPAWQSLYDLCLAPARMIVLPDTASERLHLTSLRAERFSMALPYLRGRVIDIGAGDNMLLRLYLAASGGVDPAAKDSAGVDVIDWGGDCVLVKNTTRLPFPRASVDTVCFVACLNHIPERRSALREAARILRPGGRVVATMIGRGLGRIGHALWWYSEDKHRVLNPHEEMGLDPAEMIELLSGAGLDVRPPVRFCHGLNRLYIAEKPRR
jgi:SAM-dependent methyltransferase